MRKIFFFALAAALSAQIADAAAQVTIRNRQGLHARPVMQFVDLANRFPCEIHVRKGSLQVDGKSPMEMICSSPSRALCRASPSREILELADRHKPLNPAAELARQEKRSALKFDGIDLLEVKR